MKSNVSACACRYSFVYKFTREYSHVCNAIKIYTAIFSDKKFIVEIVIICLYIDIEKKIGHQILHGRQK